MTGRLQKVVVMRKQHALRFPDSIPEAYSQIHCPVTELKSHRFKEKGSEEVGAMKTMSRT